MYIYFSSSKSPGSANNNNNNTAKKGEPEKSSNPPNKATTKSSNLPPVKPVVTIDPKKAESVEIKRLNKKISELEQKLALVDNPSNNIAAQVRNDVADNKAVAATEKKLRKQIKDLEGLHKKEKLALEKEKERLERSLKTSENELDNIVKERDALTEKLKRLAQKV